MTFHRALLLRTLVASHRRWRSPSMVLSGPSGASSGSANWRVSRTKISSSRPQRRVRYVVVGCRDPNPHVTTRRGPPFHIITELERRRSVRIQHRRQRGECRPSAEITAGFSGETHRTENLGIYRPCGQKMITRVRPPGDAVGRKRTRITRRRFVRQRAEDKLNEVAEALVIRIRIRAGDARVCEFGSIKMTLKPV